MRVIIELDNNQEIERLIRLFKEFDIANYSIIDTGQDRQEEGITKGDKDIDPSELFGIWKDSPRNIETIRREGWN